MSESDRGTDRAGKRSKPGWLPTNRSTIDPVHQASAVASAVWLHEKGPSGTEADWPSTVTVLCAAE